MNAPASVVSEPYTWESCVEVSCTRCTAKFRDEDEEAVVHFGSVLEALRSLAHHEWDVIEVGPRCPACVEEAAAAKPTLIVRERCLFCEPPLLWDGPLPEQCECTKAPHTHYESVPFISVVSHGFRVSQCLTLWCQECDEPFGREGGVAHLDSMDRARSSARKEGWRATENALVCRTCRVRAICARRGHLSDSQSAWTASDGQLMSYCPRCADDYPATPLPSCDERRRSA